MRQPIPQPHFCVREFQDFFLGDGCVMAHLLSHAARDHGHVETLYLWRYTHPRDGRVITRDHFTEAEARCILPDVERVEGSQVVAARAGHIGWCFPSGLVTRDDGVMVQRDSPDLAR